MSIADKLVVIAENQQKVYDAGKLAGTPDAGIDLFWETYQNGGERTRYVAIYGYSYFTNETFKPKYPIYLAGSLGANFEYSTITNYDALKMVDFSKVTNWNYVFQSSKAPHWGVIDTRNNSGTNIHQIFHGASVETIDEFIIKNDGTQVFYNPFDSCYNLKNIKVTGCFGGSISFGSSSLLTNESAQSIIDALMDLTGSTSKTLRFHADVGAKLTEEQKATATAKNWTIAY